MASRSFGRINRDWDPMQDDYNNSNYDSQYPDDNYSDFVKLDHCRLYIRNIPMGLTDDGLETAFKKFGTLTEVFLSKDPGKRYGIVSFETAAEARHAMMKLNKTEPLGLIISIAHERKTKEASQSRYPGQSLSTRERESCSTIKRSIRDRDESSTSNRWQTNSNREVKDLCGHTFDSDVDAIENVNASKKNSH